jgi:hypothetical protein
MKRIFTAAVTATALTLPASAQNAPRTTINLIDEAPNMAVLNAQTYPESTPYVVPPAPEGATQFAFNLKGSVFGFRVVRANFMGYVGEDGYAAYTDARTSGLGALLKKMEIWAVTRGRVLADGDLRPLFHVQQNTDKKNRRVEMNYDDATAEIAVDIRPRLGSQGVPPASPEQRYSAYDTVTALLHMTRRGEEVCSGSVPVFDSKQHYNLRLEPVGQARVKYLGGRKPAIHCHVYYEAVAGYDPEDLPSAEEAATPVDVYFRYYPEVDMHVPVRFAYKVSGFTAVVKMSDLVFVTPEGEVVVHTKD